MKKLLLVTIFLMSIALIGCQGQEAQDNQGAQQSENEQQAENKDIILATTTSTRDSGLLDVLEPMFEEQTGYNLKVVAVGTGKALSMGEAGEADALLTHAPSAEQKLVDAEAVTNYQVIMHNDFVIIGPKDDPAGIKGGKVAADAFAAIADSEILFVSRGDDSGTNKKELAIWKDGGVEPSGQWYQETGSGMGDTLVVANQKLAYTLTDRATYLAHKDNLDLEIMVEGDGVLLNIYHAMQVNPDKYDKVNAEGGKAFVEFMVNAETQEVIKDFGKDKYGQPLFFPDAGKTIEQVIKGE
ncbi:MAG: tungsten ABC transporter substrate-binding protein [Firmicutes bacterium]|nr:tungsten ABC transporter substrate-binding protein [Bacillota bacterium]